MLRKIKLQQAPISQKRRELKLTLDTYITKRLYKKLTGACDAGIEDFINTHLQQYREKGKIKLGELFPILESQRAYGVDRIKRLLAQ